MMADPQGLWSATLWAGACTGFVVGVLIAGSVFWLARRSAARLHDRIRCERLLAQDAAIAECEAFRAELDLMARSDAHPHARSIAAKLASRVALRVVERKTRIATAGTRFPKPQARQS